MYCHKVSIPAEVPQTAPAGEIQLIVEIYYPREMVGGLATRNAPVTAIVQR